MKNPIKKNTKGAGLTEFGILVGLVALIAIASVTSLGDRIATTFTQTNTALTDPETAPTPNTTPSRMDTSTIGLTNTQNPATTDDWIGTFIIRTGSPYANETSYFFGGANAYAQSRQTVTMPEGIWEEIDAQNIRAALTWDQGSYNGSDRGGMGFEFYDEQGNSLGENLSASLTAAAGGAWTPKNYSTLMPAGTRTVDVIMFGERAAGTNLDAYLNNIVASFLYEDEIEDPATDTLINGNANDGTQGWQTTSTFSTLENNGNTYFYAGSSTSLATASQDVPLSSQNQTQADNGTLDVTMAWIQNSYAGDDRGEVKIEFLDDSNAILGNVTSTRITTPANTWTARSISGIAPTGTRTLRITMTGQRFGGSNNDAYFDNLILTLN